MVQLIKVLGESSVRILVASVGIVDVSLTQMFLAVFMLHFDRGGHVYHWCLVVVAVSWMIWVFILYGELFQVMPLGLVVKEPLVLFDI